MGISAEYSPDTIRSQAQRHASSQRSIPTLSTNTTTTTSTGPILPLATTAKTTKPFQAGGLSIINGRGGSASPDPGTHDATTRAGQLGDDEGESGSGRDPEKSTSAGIDGTTSRASPPPAPPPLKSENARSGDSTIESAEGDKKPKKPKKPMTVARMKAGCIRFGGHFKGAICHSWINVLLLAVPAGIAAEAAGLDAAAVFAINAVAIVPLAGLLSHATEAVASRLGDTLGALLNVSFGNAVELIIFIIALVKNEIRIVQASLLGSILANLLLILGMAFLLGGLRYREQVYNSTVTQMSACLLSLSVMSLLLPTAFHAAFNEANLANADAKVLKVSRGTSVVLLLVYGLYLLFQLKSHAYMYESTPQEIIDEESHPGVLHELMNSSSSSDDSSSSSSSSSDTSGSGSVATTTKRMKRMFKQKKRRKSSVSTSSTQTAEQAASSVTSPTLQEPKDYLAAGSSQSASRSGSAGAMAQHDDADADREDNGISRVYDWATGKHHSHDGSKSLERKKRSKKDLKKERKRRREAEKAKKEEAARQATTTHGDSETDNQNRVGFAEEVEVAPTPTTPGRLPFNMRQLSRGQSRPILPSILSNNVFVQPAPHVTPPSTRPAGPLRSQSSGSHLRRTSSLPDRLNRQITPASTDAPPPYPRRARSIRQVNSGLSTTIIDDGDDEPMSRTAAVVLLLCSTALVAVCAEFMVDAIPVMLESNDNISEAFIGLIILPIVGNAAEHVTAVTVAAKNKMDLAIGVAVGSSIQIALFVTPVVVLLGWILDTNMSLYFNIFETVSLFVTAFVVNFLVLDGRSNYLEGSLLIAAYVIIAVGAFFYPGPDEQSSFGGGAVGGT